jgi:hypothetical protein
MRGAAADPHVVANVACEENGSCELRSPGAAKRNPGAADQSGKAYSWISRWRAHPGY